MSVPVDQLPLATTVNQTDVTILDNGTTTQIVTIEALSAAINGNQEVPAANITGVVTASQGGTGVNSLTGIVQGNGTLPMSAAPTTGTGEVVLADGPALVTPYIGDATGDSLTLGGVASNGSGSITASTGLYVGASPAVTSITSPLSTLSLTAGAAVTADLSTPILNSINNVLPGTYLFAGLPDANQNPNTIAITSDQGAFCSTGGVWQQLYNQQLSGVAITTSTPLPQVATGGTSSTTLTAMGGVSPYTWLKVYSIGANSVSVSSTGTLSIGTTNAETTVAIVQCTDSTGTSVQKTITQPVISSVNPAATPVISPATGTYTGTQTVTITCSSSGANIYYTTNGTTPVVGGTAYTGPIAVSATTTVKAIAAGGGFTASPLATSTITITSSNTYVNPMGINFGSTNLSEENFPIFKNLVRCAQLGSGATVNSAGWPNSTSFNVVLWQGHNVPVWLSNATSTSPFKCGFIGTGSETITGTSCTIANIVHGTGGAYTTFDLYGVSPYVAPGSTNIAVTINISNASTSGTTNIFAYLPNYPAETIDTIAAGGVGIGGCFTNEAVTHYSQYACIKSELWSNAWQNTTQGVGSTGAHPNIRTTSNFQFLPNSGKPLPLTFPYLFAYGASFTGSVSGTTLTVTAVASGSIAVGAYIEGSGITTSTYYITANGTGFGGVGTYTLNSSPGTIASQTITTDPSTKTTLASAFTGITGKYGASPLSGGSTPRSGPNAMQVLNLTNGSTAVTFETGNLITGCNIVAVPINSQNNGMGSQFTGSVSGTTLTVTAVSFGTISVGTFLSTSGSVPSPISPNLYYITSLGTGTGGTGTYNLNTTPGTVSSETINGSVYALQYATEGYPFQWFLQFCIACNTSIYWNLPTMEDGTNYSAGTYCLDIVQQYATAKAANPTWKGSLYLSIGNELWNLGQTLAPSLIAWQLTPLTNYGAQQSSVGQANYMAYRYYEMANLINGSTAANYFTNGNALNGLIGVVAEQQDTTNGLYYQNQMLTFLTGSGGTPPALNVPVGNVKNYIQYLSQAPYLLPTFPIEPTLTLNSSSLPAAGATSANLSSKWYPYNCIGDSGPWTVTFSTGDVRTVTFPSSLSASNTLLTWTGGLSGNVTSATINVAVPTETQMLNALNNQAQIQCFISAMEQYAILAFHYGLQLSCYEAANELGGLNTSQNNPAIGTLLTDTSATPYNIKQIMTTYYQNVFNSGCTLNLHFQSGITFESPSSNFTSPGYFLSNTYLTTGNPITSANSPTLAAMQTFMAGFTPTRNYINARPTTISGANYADNYSGVLPTVIIGKDFPPYGNACWPYLINVATAGNYTVTLNTTGTATSSTWFEYGNAANGFTLLNNGSNPIAIPSGTASTVLGTIPLVKGTNYILLGNTGVKPNTTFVSLTFS